MNRTVAKAIRVLHKVMEGESIGRHEVARALGVKVAGADSTMRALELLPGVAVERGVISCDARYRVDTPSDVMVLAGAIGLSIASIFGDSAQAKSMRKLLRRMMAGGRRRIASVDRKFYFVDAGGELALDSPEPVLDEVSEAVRDNRRLSIKYRHNNGREEILSLEPLSLVVFQHQLYVIAKRPTDGACYPYRLSRIVTADIKDTFEYPDEVTFDPARLFEHTLGIHIAHSDGAELVRFKLTGAWANYPRSHRWHKSQVIEEVDGGVVVSLEVRVCPEVETLILSFGEHVEVLDPPGLRQRVATRIHLAADIYR